MKKVGWIGLVSVAMTAPTIVLWYHLSASKHPADEVEFWSRETAASAGAAGEIESDLKSITISKIDFQDKPFFESLDDVFENLNKERLYEHEIKYAVLDPENYKDSVITLKLSNVPVMTALKYTTALAECIFSIEPDGSILIASPSQHPEPSVKRKFRCHPVTFRGHTGQGPYDVKSELEDAGITFKESDTAEYYPDKGVIVIQARKDQMELLDAYLGVMHARPEPTIFERISDQVRSFFTPSVVP